ncbi:MAG: sialate O-acetylesterase, partial [Phormidesmis sp.]
ENPLDHDHNNIYRINVLATDSTGKADGQFLEIAVTNLVSVYLLGGQSNMAGETTDTDDLTGSPQANPLSAVQIWQPGVGEFVDLRSGFNSNYGDGDGFGAELGFGHALEAARASGAVDTEEIYLVKYAIGATSLAENWSVDGNNNTYDQFNDWVGGALSHLENSGIGYDIEGMLWMQGEHDTIDANRAANYQANLTGFISDVRDRYGANLDFVIGRLHEELTPYYYTWADEVRTAQENVADADANAYWVNTDDFAVNPVDDVHFDSFGQLALGQAFADVFIA